MLHISILYGNITVCSTDFISLFDLDKIISNKTNIIIYFILAVQNCWPKILLNFLHRSNYDKYLKTFWGIQAKTDPSLISFKLLEFFPM